MLSVTNKQHLAQKEVDALANCNSQSHIIAVQSQSTEKSRIVMLSRDDVNGWQLFLRFFNLGKLANTKVYLSEITPYLNEYKWSDVSKYAKTSSYHRAYLKVCDLANKAVVKAQDLSLFNNVSKIKVKKEIKFTLYHGSDRLNRFNVVKHIRWNPLMQYQTLSTLLHKEFSRSAVQLNYHGSQDGDGPMMKEGLSEAGLQKVKIIVSQRIPRSEHLPSGHFRNAIA